MTNDYSYRILLDERWSLEDLTNFSRLYFQNYAFIYCLDTGSEQVNLGRMRSVLEDYELRDGLSYVNIYDIFRSHVLNEERPRINSIQYSSPGWLELLLNVDVALQVAKSMGIYLSSAYATGTTYKKLYQIYIDLRHQRIKSKNESLKLKKEQIAEVTKLNNELAKGLGFKNLAELDNHTKDVEETSKLLMAHFRRLERMSKFVKSGKASFPLEIFKKK